MNKIYYSWTNFNHDVNLVSSKLTSSGFKPDYILGISRGGVTLATNLSYRHNIPVKYFKYRNELFFHNICHSDVKLLICDDINDSGKTIKSAREDIYSLIIQSNKYRQKGDLNPEYIKFLTLYNNLGSCTNVDFFAKEIDKRVDDSWLVFPWEI